MGYNRKRVRGIHRLYGKDVDWEVKIGDKKRFIIDTVPYGTELNSEQIEFLQKYCIENEYPFGFLTNGDDFIVVSGCADDEQPILTYSVIQNPDEASKILDMYSYKSYDSQKIKEYYMQFQFTLEKLKERLKAEDARHALYETAEKFADCKHSDRNVGIIKKYVDEALDGKQVEKDESSLDFEASDIEKQLEAEKVELQAKVDQLSKELQSAQSKMDAEATERSEMQSSIDEKDAEIARMTAKIDELSKKAAEAAEGGETTVIECADETKIRFEELQNAHAEELARQKEVYEAEIEKLNSLLNEAQNGNDARNVIVQAGELTADTTETEDQLIEKLQEKQIELDRLTSQMEDSKETIVKLTNEKMDLLDKIEELTKAQEQSVVAEDSIEGSDTTEDSEEVYELKSQIADKDSEIAELNSELDKAMKQIKLLNIEADSLRNSHTIQADEVQLEIGSGGEAAIVKQLVTENNQLKTQLRLMVESDDLSQQADAFAVEVAKYRDQIATLINDNTKLQQEIEQQNIKISDLNDMLVKKGTAKQTAAMELLDSIEDDPSQERTYVAVIDDSLYQERDIRRFIGICIEELYKTAAVQLMPTLYDSQNFTIKEVKNGEQCDLTLGTKRFNLDIEDDTEDSLMAKVVQMYAPYKDRVFYCKKIGTPKAEFDDLYKDKKTFDDGVIEDDSAAVQADMEATQEVADSTVEMGMADTQYSDSNVEGQVIGYGYFGIRGQDALFNYEYATCRSVKYLYTQTNQRYYKIDDDQLESQLVQSIQALIAACPQNVLEQQLNEYHNTANFEAFSDKLVPLQTLNKSKPRIPMNRLAIDHLDSMKDVMDILTVVADIFGYTEESVTIMYEMSYYADDENLQNCLADINSVQVQNNIDYPGDTTGDLFEKGIDGGIIDNTILSRNSLEIQNKLFRGLTRVITEDLNDEIVDDSQFENAVSKMLNKAVNNRRKIDPKLFGPVVGTNNRQVISTNKADVGDRFVQVKAGNQIYYIARLEPVQQMYAFIRMQQVLFGNKQIRFMMNISQDAFNFYKSEFITSNPALDIIVNTIISYIETRI